MDQKELLYKKSYPSVRKKMMLQSKTLLAFRTLIRPLRTMQQQVRIKTVFVCERFPAVNTRVGFLPCVRLFVRRQVMFE